jgi:hypothetical protein
MSLFPGKFNQGVVEQSLKELSIEKLLFCKAQSQAQTGHRLGIDGPH